MLQLSHSYFYASVNGGITWTKSADRFPGRAAIGVTPAQPNYVYVVCGTNTFYYGIFISNDGGKTWYTQSDSPNILGNEIKPPFTTSTQAEYDLAIAVSPTNLNEVHIGGINCWKSTDGGITWNYTSYKDEIDAPAGKYTHADIHALVFRGNTLYCASDGGIYYSNDGAATWT